MVGLKKNNNAFTMLICGYIITSGLKVQQYIPMVWNLYALAAGQISILFSLSWASTQDFYGFWKVLQNICPQCLQWQSPLEL